MPLSLQSRLVSYGQWTYRGAWALELCAALLGLLTGLALGYQAFNAADGSSVTSMDLALASAPFFMVALAELTKIPIATLLFSANWRWKPLIFVFLVALAGITFETVFMGLERAVALRQLRYEQTTKAISELTAKLKDAERLTDELKSGASLQRAQLNLEQIEKDAQAGAARIQTEIAGLEKQIDAGVTGPEATEIKQRLTDAIDERNRLQDQRDKEITSRTGEFERQRDSFNQRIDAARREKDLDSVARWSNELDKLVNPRPSIEQKYAPKIASAESLASDLRTKLDRLLPSSGPNAAERQGLQDRLKSLRDRFDQQEKSWEGLRTMARQAVEDAQAEQSGNREKLLKAIGDRDIAANALTAMETKRIEFARTDQVRRIAARFYGRKPEDVTEDESGLVSIIWFGSLATLAALAGPLTAIVALSLQKLAAPPQDASTSKLARLVRRLLLSWRWRRIRKVEVPVEVTVERFVDRPVEVPVEKIVKEILYVPILTDNPEAIRQAMEQTLPAEIADIVKLGAARVANAS